MDALGIVRRPMVRWLVAVCLVAASGCLAAEHGAEKPAVWAPDPCDPQATTWVGQNAHRVFPPEGTGKAFDALKTEVAAVGWPTGAGEAHFSGSYIQDYKSPASHFMLSEPVINYDLYDWGNRTADDATRFLDQVLVRLAKGAIDPDALVTRNATPAEGWLGVVAEVPSGWHDQPLQVGSVPRVDNATPFNPYAVAFGPLYAIDPGKEWLAPERVLGLAAGFIPCFVERETAHPPGKVDFDRPAADWRNWTRVRVSGESVVVWVDYPWAGGPPDPACGPYALSVIVDAESGAIRGTAADRGACAVA